MAGIVRTSLLLFAVVAFLPLSAGVAADGVAGAVAVWERFVADLRRGDYPAAHAAFSAESRRALPYREFLVEYGPLSAARELVVTPPTSQSASMDGDWAEVAFGGVNPATGGRYAVTVALVRVEGRWGIVAARNEEAEKAGAAARELLRLASESPVRDDPARVVAALVEANRDNPVFRYYRLEVAEGGFVAFPLAPGLQAWRADSLGVRSLEPLAADEVPARIVAEPDGTAPVPEPVPDRAASAPVILENGMPEMAEPSPAVPAAGLDDHFPEPPLFKPGGPSGPPGMEPPPVVLPDAIQ